MQQTQQTTHLWANNKTVFSLLISRLTTLKILSSQRIQKKNFYHDYNIKKKIAWIWKKSLTRKQHFTNPPLRKRSRNKCNKYRRRRRRRWRRRRESEKEELTWIPEIIFGMPAGSLVRGWPAGSICIRLISQVS